MKDKQTIKKTKQKKLSTYSIIPALFAPLSVCSSNSLSYVAIPAHEGKLEKNEEDSLSNRSCNSKSDTSYVAEHSLRFSNDVTKQQEFNLVDFDKVDNVVKALSGDSYFRPSTVFIREIKSISELSIYNFLISCALSVGDSEKSRMLDIITQSNIDYVKPWFQKFLEFLASANSPFLRNKSESMLDYYF